jgi:hypothetical protein
VIADELRAPGVGRTSEPRPGLLDDGLALVARPAPPGALDVAVAPPVHRTHGDAGCWSAGCERSPPAPPAAHRLVTR